MQGKVILIILIILFDDATRDPVTIFHTYFRARLETAPLEQKESMKGEEEKEFTKEEEERPDFSDI